MEMLVFGIIVMTISGSKFYKIQSGGFILLDCRQSKRPQRKHTAHLNAVSVHLHLRSIRWCHAF